MANTAELAIRIVSDSSDARRDITASGDAVSKWGDRANKVGRFAGRALAGGILAAGAAAVKFTQAAAEDAESAAKLEDALKRTTKATDDQVASVEKWIETQGKQLGVADDELRPALARLVTVTKDVGSAQRLASLAMNISALSGKPLKTVTEALAKAQTGSVTALAKYGVQVKNSKGDVKSLDSVMLDLTKTYAGAASKAADTAAGRQKRLSVAMGELQEKIGAKLLPVMEKLIDVGFKVIDWIDRNQKLVGTLAVAIGGLLAVTYTITKAIAAWNAITAAGAALRSLFIIQTTAATAATGAQAAATTGAAGAQTALNTAMRLNPIGLIITAVALLVAGFVLLYKRSETFRDLVQKVGAIGRDAVGWIVDKVKVLVGWFSTAFNWLKEKIPTAFGTMKDLAVRYIQLVTAPWRTLFGLIRDAYDWLREKIPAALQTVKDKMGTIARALLSPWNALKGVIDKIIGLANTAISKAREALRLGSGKDITSAPGQGPIAPSFPESGGSGSPSLRVAPTSTTLQITVEGSIIGTTDEAVGHELLTVIDRARRTRGLPPLGT